MSFADDPHSERGFACPANKFGITDYAELSRYEEPLVTARAVDLEYRGISGKFDAGHLKFIHRYLFQDVFPWAGEFRVVNIFKANSVFAPAIYLESTLIDLLERLKRERFLSGLATAAFAPRGAFYLAEINAIHPFPEGNGRTQREFVRQLALKAGHPISWAGFTQAEMIEASVASLNRGVYGPMEGIVYAALLSTRQAARAEGTTEA